MSARRMPCKRCHHPRPVGTDGYCGSCAEILRQLKLPKSTPPSGPFEIVPCGANQLDAQGGPKCACGKPSAFEDGSCVDCAVDGAKRVDEWAERLATDLTNAGEAERDALTGDEGPITERSSKTSTTPPAAEGDQAAALDAAGFGNAGGASDTVTRVAPNGDPEKAVCVTAPPAGGAAVEFNAATTLFEAPPEPTMTEEDGSEPPDSIKEVDVAASEAPAS